MRSYPQEFGQKVALVAKQLMDQPWVEAAPGSEVSDEDSLQNLARFFNEPIDDFWEDVVGLDVTYKPKGLLRALWCCCLSVIVCRLRETGASALSACD